MGNEGQRKRGDKRVAGSCASPKQVVCGSGCRSGQASGRRAARGLPQYRAIGGMENERLVGTRDEKKAHRGATRVEGEEADRAG